MLFKGCKHVQVFAIGGGLCLDIVDLYAIVKVKGDAQTGKVGDILLVLFALGLLQLQLVQPCLGKRYRAGIAAGGNDVVFLHDLLGIGAQQRAEIVVVDAAGGVGIPAVEIDQRLEAVLFAAVEHPVDGALLVNLAVICEEIFQEIVADDLTAGVALASWVQYYNTDTATQ